MDLQQYLADIDGIEADTLLDDWRWLLGGQPYTLFRTTAMGDLIVRAEEGRFHMLDMIEGKLRVLGDSETELWATLSDRQARKTLLLTFVVRNLRASGVILGPGQCYSPDVPPILGGSLDSSNLQPCDIVAHASIAGQIHQQIR